jgi:hypothetical protein
MQTSNKLDPTSQLAPSELVLLNGERFAKKRVWWGGVELLHTKTKVSSKEIGLAILEAAFLANEEAGAIRLEVGQKKTFFGLFQVTTLFAVPSENAPKWPAHSLESYVHQHTSQGRADVSTIIYRWLGHDSFSPWNSAVNLIKKGMAQRGMLEEIKEKKRLKFFTATHYMLLRRTERLARYESVEPVQQALAVCQQARPEVWNLLVTQIKGAIASRTLGSD